MGNFLFFNFSWGGEKNTLLQALVSALLVAACKSVFFCGWLFILTQNIFGNAGKGTNESSNAVYASFANNDITIKIAASINEY